MMCMSFKKIAILTGCLLIITLQNAWSQKRWDGGAGDNLWSSRLNWETDSLPVLSDSVLLDNSLISGNYSVILPHGVVNISISTIIIKPTDSALIRLILPSGNTAIPGLSLLGAGGIRLFSGGEFQNSSGGSPGLAVTITDSLYIFNGGKEPT